MPRPKLVVDGQTDADATYMNNEIIGAIGDLLKLKPELGDGATESLLDVLNKFANQGYLNLILNPDFSSFDQQGNLLKWTTFASTVSRVTTSTDNSLGHDFVSVTTDGSGANAGIKQTTTENSLLNVLLPRLKAQQLPVSLKVKVRSTVPISVAINDTVEQSTGSGAWEEVVVRRAFTGTETDLSVQIYVPGTANTSAVSFDVGEAVLVVGETAPVSFVTGVGMSQDPQPNTIPIADANGYLNSWINQGAGSGLDADTVDGLDRSGFLERNPDYDSGWFTVSRASNNVVTLAHNLGILPKLVVVQIHDTANNVYYTHIGTNPQSSTGTGYQQPLSVIYDQINIYLHVYSAQYLVQWWNASVGWQSHDNHEWRVFAWK